MDSKWAGDQCIILLLEMTSVIQIHKLAVDQRSQCAFISLCLPISYLLVCQSKVGVGWNCKCVQRKKKLDVDNLKGHRVIGQLQKVTQFSVLGRSPGTERPHYGGSTRWGRNEEDTANSKYINEREKRKVSNDISYNVVRTTGFGSY